MRIQNDRAKTPPVATAAPTIPRLAPASRPARRPNFSIKAPQMKADTATPPSWLADGTPAQAARPESSAPTMDARVTEAKSAAEAMLCVAKRVRVMRTAALEFMSRPF